MFEMFTSAWWALILRGLFAVLFGVLAIAWPRLDVQTLAQLFGAYAIIDGIITVLLAIIGREEYERWWLQVAEGVVSLVAGALAIIYTGITESFLLNAIAIRALVVGGVEMAVAFELRKEVENEWLLAVGSFMSLAFGVIVLLWPKTGMMYATGVGIFAIFYGALLAVLGWEARAGQLKRIHRPT